jgi:hypothetical protein
MNFKTKIVILSLIIIGTCLIQIALHKKTYEGFVGVSNTESTLSFSQLDRKYNNSKECKFKDFEVGQYVEINKKIVKEHPTSEFLENEKQYGEKWESAIITALLDNNQYKIKYDGSEDEHTVNENVIKSHHQNNCELCGNRDDQCSADCMDPVKIGGDCMPVRTGEDGNGDPIYYQVCPSICRNDSKQMTDLICQGDNCCKGCGYTVFQVADNTDVVSGQPNLAQRDEATILHKLTKIPYPRPAGSPVLYEIDTEYNYDEVMENDEKRIQNAMSAVSSTEPASSSIEVTTATSNGSSTSSSASATEDSVTASGEAVNSETTNIVNAFNESNDCWLGPTGHDEFKYCGPAPFSF